MARLISSIFLIEKQLDRLSEVKFRLDVDSIKRPSGDIYMATPGVACAPNQAESPHPDWVKFRGTMMISFSGMPNVVRYKIKGVK